MVTGVDPIIDFNWTGNLDHFESETVNLGSSSVVDGQNVVITITNNDDNLANNVVMLDLVATVSTTHIKVDLLTDVYPGDVSWTIFDENQNSSCNWWTIRRV
jgi:hypothetical protein